MDWVFSCIRRKHQGQHPCRRAYRAGRRFISITVQGSNCHFTGLDSEDWPPLVHGMIRRRSTKDPLTWAKSPLDHHNFIYESILITIMLVNPYNHCYSVSLFQNTYCTRYSKSSPPFLSRSPLPSLPASKISLSYGGFDPDSHASGRELSVSVRSTLQSKWRGSQAQGSPSIHDIAETHGSQKKCRR
jgi:hypothetical protein